MIQTYEAVIDEQGTVRLLHDVHLQGPRRALVTVLEDEPVELRHEAALLSEATISEDWNRPEEDAAWSYLQPAK